MRFLYAVKGCSHCDSRWYCPRELKRSEKNLSSHFRIAVTATGDWISRCRDFFRGDATDWRRRKA